MSELDTLAPGGVVQLQNAPAGLDDATFDSLFPSNPPPIVTQPPQQTAPKPDGNQAPPATQQTPPPAAQQPPASEPFIKANSSVYKTAEDAVKGINEKDALIDQLRTRYALTTGIDPVTGKPLVPQGQVAELDYTQNPKQYLEDLYAAASKNDPAAYAGVQQKLVMDTLKPVQPIIAQTVKAQAIQAVSSENPEVGKFVSSAALQTTLEANPDLKTAITTAENDSRFYSRLPGLYKLAYFANQGMQLPELLKAKNPPPANSQTTQPAQVRTTTPQTTLAPGQVAARPSFNTIAGIKATIAEMEGKGVKLDF
jgi:hypothetical protein